MPAVELPPQDVQDAPKSTTSILLEQAHGGTKHTMSTIPVWDGLWASGNNTMPAIFLVNGSLATAFRPGAAVKEGVLTPPYEKHFSERRAEVEKYGEQLYDRLTNCEYPGVPRWLWEPYVKEFVNMPDQSWLMNDMMNETRRVYIGAEHVNTEGKHFPLGDSIGFWDGDKLVIWTKWVNPADYVRGMPLTSNQFEMVETGRSGTTRRRAPARHAGHVLRSARAREAAVGRLHARVAAGSEEGRRAHPYVGVRLEQQFVQGGRRQHAVLSARRSAVQKSARLHGLSGSAGAVAESDFRCGAITPRPFRVRKMKNPIVVAAAAAALVCRRAGRWRITRSRATTRRSRSSSRARLRSGTTTTRIAGS